MSSTKVSPQSTTKAVVFGLLSFALFSTHDVLIKALGQHYAAFQILFFAALFSFPFINVALMGDPQPGTLRPKNPGWIALRSLCSALAALGAFYAFSALPMAQVYAAIFATPLIITVLAIPILGETVRLRRGLAVLVGLLGVLVVLRPGSSELSYGHLAALLCAAAGALNSIITRKIGSQERPMVMMVYPMMINFLVASLFMPFFYVPMSLRDLGISAIVSALVLMAMFSLIQAYRNGPAILVAPMQYSQIIWAALFGAFLFDEFPDKMTYLGIGIIITSGLYILRRETDQNVSANRPVLRTRTRLGLPIAIRVGTLIKSQNERTK